MIEVRDDQLHLRNGREQVLVQAWGRDGIRVRATLRTGFTGEAWALLEDVHAHERVVCGKEGDEAFLQNGRITARVNAEGWLSFENERGEILLEEYWRNRNNIYRFATPLNLSAREMEGTAGEDSVHLRARFEARDGERIYGMGQYQDAHLDRKGSVLELAHRNTQSSVPFYVSSLGYGFLWNNPAVGRVSFATNMTEWEAYSTKELDYYIVAGDTPGEILSLYADATGHAPMMPEYGMGYWQCRLRYRTQKELMDVARRHKALGLPLDVIVADFFHWTIQGEFMFDPENWPDVPGMVRELREMGVELMASIWPTVDSRSVNYPHMREQGMLVTCDRGQQVHMNWMGECVFMDVTNPEARKFVWERVKENYYDNGVRVFWLDEAEPEYGKYDFDIMRYQLGPAMQVTNLYPALYAKTFYDGQVSQGQEQVLNLARCAWAGSQRYGTLLWSGDVDSSFRSMRDQLCCGLSAGMAGIPWWDSDLGGFSGGVITDEAFREVLARWFAWGAFMPVMRMHGDRLPYEPPVPEYNARGVRQFGSGAPNEVWSFGPQMQALFEKYIKIREALRPYTRAVMEEAHRTGAPAMRPLFFQYPGDDTAWTVEDAYLYGPDILVAPVMDAQVDHRKVYLPVGDAWVEQATGKEYAGGQVVTAHAPLEVIPVFVRKGADVKIDM